MEFITLEVKNYIGYITLERPPANALNRQAYSEMAEAFRSIKDRLDEVRVVILTAKGKQFIAGNDVNDFSGTTKSEMAVQGGFFSDCVSAVYDCPVPVICAVNGAAVGAGFCIAASCDFIIASERARFGTPEIKVGVLGGISFLPLLVPSKVGRYMSATGNLLPAAEIARYGGIHKVVPPEELMPEAEKLAAEVLQAPPLALRAWKKAYNLIENLCWTEKEHITDLFIEDLMDTEDYNEAVNAFLEKREPVYKGK